MEPGHGVPNENPLLARVRQLVLCLDHQWTNDGGAPGALSFPCLTKTCMHDLRSRFGKERNHEDDYEVFARRPRGVTSSCRFPRRAGLKRMKHTRSITNYNLK